MRTGDQDGGTHLGIDGLRQVVSDHDGRRGLIVVARARCAALVSRAAALPRVTLESRSLTRRSCAGTMPSISAPPERAPWEMSTCSYSPGEAAFTWGSLLQPRRERAPVADAVAGHAHQLHMSRRAQQPVLQIAAHAVGDGEGNDQRSYTGGHAGDGDDRDDAHDRLAALGPQIAHGDKKLEAHRLVDHGLGRAHVFVAVINANGENVLLRVDDGRRRALRLVSRGSYGNSREGNVEIVMLGQGVRELAYGFEKLPSAGVERVLGAGNGRGCIGSHEGWRAVRRTVDCPGAR